MVYILLIIWGIFTLMLLGALIRDGLEFLIRLNINDRLDRRIGVLYRA